MPCVFGHNLPIKLLATDADHNKGNYEGFSFPRMVMDNNGGGPFGTTAHPILITTWNLNSTSNPS